MSSSRTIIGVDVGGTKVVAALLHASSVPPRICSARGKPEVLRWSTMMTDVSSPEACLARISACIDHVTAGSAIEGIGIGIASLMDYDEGRALCSMHLPLTDVPVRDLLERHHRLPVAIDNDATAACIGEHAWGAGRGSRDLLMLTLGTGVGGGIICDGRPYRGSVGTAGELGHVMVDVNGPKCPGNCPNWGCLEAYVSGTAMGTAATAAARRSPGSSLGRALRAGETVDSRLLTQLALEGHGDAVALLTRLGEYLGVGLVTLTNIFNPEVIVVGGGAAAAGELLLEPARGVVARRALPPARERVRLVPALLGPEAGVFGAAALILSRLDEPSDQSSDRSPQPS